MKRHPLRGQVALITGASSGIGRSTALAFAREGVDLILSARNGVQLDQVGREAEALGVRALVVPADVTDRTQVQALCREALARFGAVHILVCNAGQYIRVPVRDLTVEAFQRAMAVNFYGSIYPILELLPQMLSRKDGRIIVVSSLDGKKGMPNDSPYVATKFALNGVTEVMRQELRGSGVYVSTILPGRIETPMIEHLRVPWISGKIPADPVARTIVRAATSHGGEFVTPYVRGKLLIVANALSPALTDWAVRILHLQGWEDDLFSS